VLVLIGRIEIKIDSKLNFEYEIIIEILL